MTMDQTSFANGVVADTRPAEEKAKDFRYEELFGAPSLTWRPYEEWLKDPYIVSMLKTIEIQDQAQSFSCLAQAGALALSIDNWIEEGRYIRMSARSFYPFRRNKPGEGMWVNDLGNLVKTGAIFESVLPSEKKDETGMNDISDYVPSFDVVRKVYKAKNYFWIPVSTIDECAAILNSGRSVVIAVRFGSNEWEKVVPTINSAETKYGHGIVLLPKASFIYEGKKAAMLQDSWGVKSGINGRRILTEDWFTKGRVFAAIWFEDMNNLTALNPSLELPKFNFTKDLTVGSRGDDVAMLQRCLGYLQDKDGYLFPLVQEPTGYYGGITRSAVKRFQALNGLSQTGIFDAVTRKKANEIFA